jgi:hypothetical protein
MKNNDAAANDDVRPEYDLSQLKDGVRGKYFERFRAGSNLPLLAPDVRSAISELVRSG